jgi:hypothetical protein
MKFKDDRPIATPEATERKLLELANGMEADHAAWVKSGRLSAKQLGPLCTPGADVVAQSGHLR